MKCSTEVIQKMAEMLVAELEQVGIEGAGIGAIETTLRVMLVEVGAKALGQYLERQNEEIREEEVICGCGEERLDVEHLGGTLAVHRPITRKCTCRRHCYCACDEPGNH